MPRTIFSLGVQQLSRVQYYDLASFNANAGYKWAQTSMQTHELNPIAISFLKLGRTTRAFDSLLLVNPFLQRSYESQFIAGSTYSYTYNTQVNTDRKVNYYVNGAVDVAGNLLHTLQGGFSARNDAQTPKHLLGSTYSQYAKGTIDARYYNQLSRRGKLATRAIVGVGRAYGNSDVLPFTKQYFIGGNNSVRAFQPRTLGPGAYRIPDSVRGSFFVDQAGDIKLELNAEYRFDIFSIVKGAVFADAGNIWLMRANPTKPGAEFVASKFISQLAVGAGAGLRFDASFFVLRLDLATPLRRPDAPGGPSWVLNDIKWTPEWRRKNLVLNIAIGYPF